MLVEQTLDSSAILLRHRIDFPILDNRHRARGGVPRLPGTGRTVEDRVQGVRLGIAAVVARPPNHGLSIQAAARFIHAPPSCFFEYAVEELQRVFVLSACIVG